MAELAVVAAILVVSGSLLVTIATRRVPFVAAVLVVLVLLPLCGRPFPTSAGWAIAASAHLVATLLGALLLWIGLRATGARLETHQWLPARSWLFVAAGAAAVGVMGWPLLIETLDPTQAAAARLVEWSDPMRWALGAGMGVLGAAASLILGAPEPPRLAAGAALGAAAAWLVGISAAAPVADLALPACSVVLPCAASLAAWRALRAPA